MASTRSKLLPILPPLTPPLHIRPTILPIRFLIPHTTRQNPPHRPLLPIPIGAHPPPLLHRRNQSTSSTTSSSTTTTSSSSSSTSSPSAIIKPYTYEEMCSVVNNSTNTDPNSRDPHNSDTNPPQSSSSRSGATIIIDVREPTELHRTGRIPGAYSMPLTSNPDAFYLDEGEFGERFGFERPRARQKSRLQPQPQPHKEDGETKQEDRGGKEEHGKEANPSSAVDEVIFYCHAGVRSRAAARMAREWKGVRVGDMRGGWAEWEGRGGEVER